MRAAPKDLAGWRTIPVRGRMPADRITSRGRRQARARRSFGRRQRMCTGKITRRLPQEDKGRRRSGEAKTDAVAVLPRRRGRRTGQAPRRVIRTRERVDEAAVEGRVLLLLAGRQGGARVGGFLARGRGGGRHAFRYFQNEATGFFAPSCGRHHGNVPDQDVCGSGKPNVLPRGGPRIAGPGRTRRARRMRRPRAEGAYPCRPRGCEFRNPPTR